MYVGPFDQPVLVFFLVVPCFSDLFAPGVPSSRSKPRLDLGDEALHMVLRVEAFVSFGLLSAGAHGSNRLVE